MSHFAGWYRREDYQRIREIVVDGSKFPAEFDEWRETAKKQVKDAKLAGLIIKAVFIDPDDFLAFCNETEIQCDGEAKAKFIVPLGASGQNPCPTEKS